MAYVPAGEDFDEDGFDFGDDDVQETASNSSSCYPEPTLAQVDGNMIRLKMIKACHDVFRCMLLLMVTILS